MCMLYDGVLKETTVKDYATHNKNLFCNPFLTGEGPVLTVYRLQPHPKACASLSVLQHYRIHGIRPRSVKDGKHEQMFVFTVLLVLFFCCVQEGLFYFFTSVWIYKK